MTSSAVPAIVGLPLGKRLPTFAPNGTATVWLAPAELIAAVAGGQLPRRAAGPGVSTQVLTINVAELTASDTEGHSWPLTHPSDHDVFSPQEAGARMRQLLFLAARRGENVIFTPNAPAEVGPPCLRSSVVRSADGSYQHVLETFPQVPANVWPSAHHDEHSSNLTVPAGVKAISDAVPAIIRGASTFALAPDLLGLFFERAADGPWPGEG